MNKYTKVNGQVFRSNLIPLTNEQLENQKARLLAEIATRQAEVDELDTLLEVGEEDEPTN
jgi:hypothetical protein